MFLKQFNIMHIFFSFSSVFPHYFAASNSFFFSSSPFFTTLFLNDFHCYCKFPRTNIKNISKFNEIKNFFSLLRNAEKRIVTQKTFCSSHKADGKFTQAAFKNEESRKEKLEDGIHIKNKIQKEKFQINPEKEDNHMSYDRTILENKEGEIPYVHYVKNSNHDKSNKKCGIVLIYANDIDQHTLKQFENLALQEFIVSHVSAMCDAHLGKGAPIGCTFATRNHICPNAVGVDIGCGVFAVCVKGLAAEALNRRTLNDIFKDLKDCIPTGCNSYSSPIKLSMKGLLEIARKSNPSQFLRNLLWKKVFEKKAAEDESGKEAMNFCTSKYSSNEYISSKYLRSCNSKNKDDLERDELNINHLTKYGLNVLNQVGTLGGGNHFLEISLDENKNVWFLIHSGSRNLGKTVAEYYDTLASKKLSSTKQHNGLAHLRIDSAEGSSYLADMIFCLNYAKLNRTFLMQQLLRIVEKHLGFELRSSIQIDIHHNYCQPERATYYDFNKKEFQTENLWITRKGATSAKKGEWGIIPGSMGTNTYIVKGKGVNWSWNSCSHGAGRKISRTAAKKTLSMEDFKDAMTDVICDTSRKLIDEAPNAYKNIEEVMWNQRSLIEIKYKLTPILNLKGF